MMSHLFRRTVTLAVLVIVVLLPHATLLPAESHTLTIGGHGVGHYAIYLGDFFIWVE